MENRNNKQILLEIFEAGVQAVQPDEAVLGHLSLENDILKADGTNFDLKKGAVFVVGAGKGAFPMAAAVEKLFGDRIARGLIVVKYGHGGKAGRLEIVEAAHPVPDAAGLAGASGILELAAQCQPHDLLICLFTGGASALLPAPADDITLAELQQTTSLLLASGADINEMNAVRKHLSRLSGGQLARAANGARVLSIIVSDVVGDRLDAIASGPTAPDSTTFADCLEIMAKYGLEPKLPPNVLKRLRSGASGKLPETPKPGDPLFKNVVNQIVASNAQALEAAAAKARTLGFNTKIIEEPMGGEACAMSIRLVDEAKRLAQHMEPGATPICLLAGGETTVIIKGGGKGGRNQEMALAASLELGDCPDICGLFAGTDGTDGPTDAAGGFAFGVSSAAEAAAAQSGLLNNDSYNALKKTGNLLLTGPTRTNVMDIAILLIEGSCDR